MIYFIETVFGSNTLKNSEKRVIEANFDHSLGHVPAASNGRSRFQSIGHHFRNMYAKQQCPSMIGS